MDHIAAAGARGEVVGHLDSYYKGRRPGGVYVPRFRNVDDKDSDFLRGYGFQGRAGRSSWQGATKQQGLGKSFKDGIRQPSKWWFFISGFGEVLPDFNNKVSLHASKKDQWGMPLLVTNVSYDENSAKMREDMQKSAEEMLTTAGLTNISTFQYKMNPGAAVHEMGGACMGKDPKTSYLNKWNQSHEVNNLFVTDGAAFPSISCVNPSITFMALTARAVDYADKQIKAGKI